MSKRIQHLAPPRPSPVRLQEYGIGLFVQVPTRSAWKKAIKKGWVMINDRTASTADWVRGGEEIQLTIPDSKKTPFKIELDLNVLYEDEHLAVVAKPAGIEVSGNRKRTVANALLHTLEYSTVKDAVRPQPIHRLDYPTSGALLVGKTAEAIRKLGSMFDQKEVIKYYLAVTIGSMPDSGVIRHQIDQKEAITRFEILQSVSSKRFEQLNLVKLQPATGRRHQLRKHMAALGNYILGDREYCPEKLLLKGKGLYLHAGALEFTNPFSGSTLKIVHPTPDKYKKIFPYFDIDLHAYL